MTRIRRLAAHAGFSVLLSLMLIEMIGLVDFFIKTQELYYFSPPAIEVFPDKRKWEHSVEAHRLHPYFGFVARPSVVISDEGRETHLNNYGFYSLVDYPYQPRHGDELLVGFFGGSVASKLHGFEGRQRILARRLAAALGRDVDDVTVLNFAQGGFKQPQQLLIYSYFRSLGQELDVVLNIDGFNEIALSATNLRRGVAAEMPSIDHIGSLQLVVGSSGTAYDAASGPDPDQMLRVRSSYRRYAEMHHRAWSGKAWELSFAGGFFIDRKLARLSRKRFQSDLLAFSSMQAASADSSWLHLNRSRHAGNGAGPAGLAATVELWANASSIMHLMQSHSGSVYLHFVQPNQYHRTKRVYGEHERSVAFDERSPYADPIRHGYPRLRAEAERLRATGVPVYDLTDLFDELETEAYSDNCCHYTDFGQEALAGAVAEIAASAMSANATPLSSP